MNTDIDPLSRWLDGRATEAQTDALVRAVEEDPGAMRALVEVSLMEAGLRQHLPEGAAPVRPLSLPPLWHWKRAGRWIAAAGSLAAAGVAAWLFLSPPGNADAPDAALADATAGKMKIRRVPAGSGARAQIPGGSQHPGMTAPTAPLVERSYRPSKEVLAMLDGSAPEVSRVTPRPPRVTWADIFHTGKEHAKPAQKPSAVEESAVFPIPEMQENWEARDERLGRLLRGSGVEFPEGAIARRAGAAEVILNLTETGHEQAARVLASTAEKPYPGVIISASYYGTDPPPQLQGDRIITAAEMQADKLLRVLAALQNDPRTGEVAEARRAIMWPEMQCRLNLAGDTLLPDPFASPDRFARIFADLPVTFNLWRTGDHYVVRGTLGLPLDEDGNPPPGASEIEFDVTLMADDHAVIHLDDWPRRRGKSPEKHFVLLGLKQAAVSMDERIDQWLARCRDVAVAKDRPMEATIRSNAGIVICQVHGTGDGIEVRLPSGPVLAFSTTTRKWTRKDEGGREIQGTDVIPGTDLACEDVVWATWPWLHWRTRIFRGEESVKTRDCFVFDLKAPGESGRFRTVRAFAAKGREGDLPPVIGGLMKLYGYDQKGDRTFEATLDSAMRIGEAVLPKELTLYTYAPGSSKVVSETTVIWTALPVAGADSGE